MKIIKLLNMMAQKEKIPSKIKLVSDGTVYELSNGSYVRHFVHYGDELWTETIDLFADIEMTDLNKEVILEDFLDEKEKEYLSAVIKPFRNDVVSIKKLIFNDKKEYLKIDFKDIDYINFRNFKKGTMYKGMEIGKEYTLEELGL